MIHHDHVQVGASDAEASARFLAEVLGVPAPVAEGEDDDMFRIDFDHGEFLLFAAAPKPIAIMHVAYRVDRARFDAVVARLRARGVPFGNHHEGDANGETSDPLGGSGRAYFRDADGHLWEVAC